MTNHGWLHLVHNSTINDNMRSISFDPHWGSILFSYIRCSKSKSKIYFQGTTIMGKSVLKFLTSALLTDRLGNLQTSL